MTSSGKPKAIVIGTGFGGAVTAHRLVNSGFDVVVLERGRRFQGNDFPSLPTADEVFPDFARWGWASSVVAAEADEKHAVDATEQVLLGRLARRAPRPKHPAPPRHSGPSHWSIAQGLWDVRDMGGVVSAHAAGYGGGSLVYANVHLRAPQRVFASSWPKDIEGHALEKYYDRVASMLDIKPITESHERGIPPKTIQLQKAAGKLQRSTFYPPLAINFTKRERAGRAQAACTFCGECDTGCRVGAKNTLDLNYLVDVDAKADVRTLAEVLWIEPTGLSTPNAPESDRYTVTYFDHLLGTQEAVRAKYVFLCAGSVCSTEILLRSKARHCLPNISNAVGAHFYANADSLAIVFDTKEKNEPSNGPTITTALVHEEENGPWFMIQDGGYPEALTRAVGTFRARALLGRNAYPAPSKERDVVDPFKVKLSPERKAPFRGFPDGIFWLLRSGDLAKAPTDIVPPDLRAGLTSLLQRAHAVGREELEVVVPAVTAKMRAQKIDRLLRRCHLGKFTWLRKALLKHAAALQSCLGASDDALVGITQDLLIERYAPSLDNAARIGSWLLNWEIEPTKPAHRAVLLGMGRDDKPGHYYLDVDGRIQVRLTLDPKVQTYSEQELLMRDLAAKWEAELRVNPTWAAGRRPVTVHHQGGCPMADDPNEGVVDEWGKVHGYEGLFVSDGSILPRPVGVNPSSTIAALAERNVEQFINTCGESGVLFQIDPQEEHAIEEWRARAAAKGWAKEPPSGSSAPADATPIGVVFDEVMSGFHAPLSRPLSGDAVYHALFDELGLETAPAGRLEGTEGGARSPESNEVFDLEPRARAQNGRPPISAEAKDYEAAYRIGCAENTIVLTLTGTAKDIVAFDADDQHRLTLGGRVEFHWPSENVHVSAPASGQARFFVPLTFADYTGPDRIMLYELTFHDEAGTPWHLLGFKRMHAGEGTRAWADTTNLFVTIWTPGRKPTMGVARLSMERFLYQVLGKMKVTGTDDPTRKTWALAIYGEVLFGHLWDIYFAGLLRSKALIGPRPLSRRA